jgi:hypothetical protein
MTSLTNPRSHEARARGVSRGGTPTLAFAFGSSLPATATSVFSKFLLGGATSTVDGVPQSALAEELVLRGYELGSLQISILHGEADSVLAIAPRVLTITPGRLKLRWGAHPGDRTPTMCTSWGAGCTKRDAALLYGLVSMPADTADAQRFGKGSRQTFFEALQAEGFDTRTFRLDVRKVQAAVGYTGVQAN